MAQATPEVVLISYTLDPEQTVVAGIRQCYSPKGGAELKEKTKEEVRDRLINQIVSSGHTSTIEHANFTFAITGVSRALTHQLVRHRIASYSHQSQRYVEFADDFPYIIPPKIKKNPKALELYEKHIQNLSQAYKDLMALGIDKEDARYLAPNAAETKIVVTMNARALLHFLEKRLCSRAQWEIRILAQKMLDLVKEVAPEIFKNAGPSCVSQKICWEGDLACDRWKTIEGAELRKGH